MKAPEGQYSSYQREIVLTLNPGEEARITKAESGVNVVRILLHARPFPPELSKILADVLGDERFVEMATDEVAKLATLAALYERSRDSGPRI